MQKNKQPSENLHLIGYLSSSISIVVSSLYIGLCATGIYFRNNCNAGLTSSATGSEFLIRTLHRLYFKQEDCQHSIEVNADVTQEHTVFLLTLFVLVLSIVCLISAICFITVLKLENGAKFIETFGYIYITVCFLSLIMDLVAAVHFGMDYTTFKLLMNNSSAGVTVNYLRDMYRLSALFLMILSLKGFVVPFINTIFVVLLIVYLVEFRKNARNEVHSIHKVGALNGYDQPRRFDELQSENSFQHLRAQPKRNEDPWQQSSDNAFPYKGSHINPVFVNDGSPRNLHRDTSRQESLNPSSLDRSYSWQQNQPSVASRPFSYLEDTKPRAAPPPKAPSPSREPQWASSPTREPQWAPHVPAPDYSPDAPRRLKSALKSSYM